MGLCAAAPEAIFQSALGQWRSARDATHMFRASGYQEWSMSHSFYVDMGGLHLRSPDYPSFPINSRQLHFLVTRDYVAYPQLQKNQIRDKNKVDPTLRFITLIQTLFFSISLLVRAAQKLAITALELSTAAFVVLSFASTILWLHKPGDVEECDFIETSVPIATIMADSNLSPDATYAYTPLDFISRQEWSWSILWMHGLNLLRKLHLAGQPRELPTQRVQNTVVPRIKGRYTVLLATLSVAYLCLFIAGWNYTFPTPTERMLWRSASLTALITASLIFTSQQLFFKWIPALKRKSAHKKPSPQEPHNTTPSQIPPSDIEANEPPPQEIDGKIQPQPHPPTKLPSKLRHTLTLIASTLRNNSPTQDPALDAPISAVLATWLLGAFYVSARGYIIIADLTELRSLPASAYRTLNWAALAPFIP
ncbi:MAG: hypothetical protein Q9160_008475 [Pyrenula sp. 1 TL-2023]